MLVMIREFLVGVAVFISLLSPMFMSSFDDNEQPTKTVITSQH